MCANRFLNFILLTLLKLFTPRGVRVCNSSFSRWSLHTNSLNPNFFLYDKKTLIFSRVWIIRTESQVTNLIPWRRHRTPDVYLVENERRLLYWLVFRYELRTSKSFSIQLVIPNRMSEVTGLELLKYIHRNESINIENIIDLAFLHPIKEFWTFLLSLSTVILLCILFTYLLGI